jgi:uroporphyrinogen-III synthase
LKKVFITRDLKEADFFKTALEEVGFSVFGQSLIAFSKIDFGIIPDCDWLFFYSKNGVKYFFENIDNQWVINKKIGTIGASTSDFLMQNFGLKADFVGTGEPLQTAKNFLQIAANQTVIFPRAKQSKQSIQQELGNAIIAKDLVVYENQPLSDFDAIEADILVFTSPMNVEAYFNKMVLKPNQKIVSIGNTTAKALESLDIEGFFIAETPSEKGLVKAVLFFEP